MKSADVELSHGVSAATSSVARRAVSSPRAIRESRLTLTLGIAICAIVPALFWCGLIWYAGSYLGLVPGALILATIGAGIALFLSVIASAVMSGP